MKRVLLLGATGMLGSAIYSVLREKYELVLAVRNPEKVKLLEAAYGSTNSAAVVQFDAAAMFRWYSGKRGHPCRPYCDFLQRAGPVDYAINAIGVTIPYALRDPALTLFVNGGLPHILARSFGEQLIHITTDCVYSGEDGNPYDETSPKTPVDLYGLSKSLGEPAECLTIRTSIIGRELAGFTGLLEWFLGQEGNTVTGFANHFWNGITTQQFGVLCDKLMSAPSLFPRCGVFHVFSTRVSKYEILRAFQKKYGVKCTIERDDTKRLNRCLTTIKPLNSALQVPSFDEMMAALQD